MRDWPEREYTVKEAREDYPKLWDKIWERFEHLSTEDREMIFSLVVGTCPHCYEDGKGCACWRDE